MTAANHTRWRTRVGACLLGAALLGAAQVAVAAPASAHMPPLSICHQYTEGAKEFQPFVDGTEDIIVWTCTKAREIPGYPVLYYWDSDTMSDDLLTEARKAGKDAVIRKVVDQIWQAVLQSEITSWGPSEADRAHIRYVGGFDLRSWGGTPIPRQINIHMVAKYSVNGGGSWTTCGDTGWKSTGTPKPQLSVEFYKLSTSCPGQTTLHTRARFLQASGTWYTTGWLQAGPIPSVPPLPV